MKITRENWLKATADAMSRENTKKLFEASPSSFDLFSMFSYLIWLEIDGKDVTEEDIADVTAKVITELSTADELSNLAMIKSIALIIFSIQIYEELEKATKSEQKNPDYDKFKSGLKSKSK